ncbi:MAG: replication protein [Clostridia bacterium]|nr:replication protein [Clostridia bacterium]
MNKTPVKISPTELEEQEEARAIVFQHGIMCQVGLPRSRQQGRIFERTFKNASIRIEGGSLWDGFKWQEQPIPYGAKPRLALLYINSQAIKTREPEIDIGHSYGEFCERLGLSKGGTAFYELKKQMNALAACKMSFGFTHPDGIATTLPDIKPVARFDAWMAKDSRQPSLWPATLRLGHEYMESLLQHAIPLPFEAMASLKDSAMSLDLLAFFARRLQSLERPIRVPFVLFKEQFGQEYKDLKPFKAKFLKSMRQVKEVYPAAQIEQVTGGLVLKPSAPLVKKAGYQEFIPAPMHIPLTFTPQTLTDKTIAAFRSLCPRGDIYACKADFDLWVQGKEFPKDYQKAFLGFAQKWATGKG